MAYGYATDNFLRYPLLAQGPRRNNYLRGGYDGGGMTWEELLNFNKDKGPIPTGRSRGQGSTEGVNTSPIQIANPFKDWKWFGGSGLDAATETKNQGSGMGFFHDFYKMTPEEFLKMQGAEARKGVDHMLGSQMKYNLITKQIPSIGRQLGLGGAPQELAAQLAADKNSTAVTMASVMRPGPRTLIQPYRSYFG